MDYNDNQFEETRCVSQIRFVGTLIFFFCQSDVPKREMFTTKLSLCIVTFNCFKTPTDTVSFVC